QQLWIMDMYSFLLAGLLITMGALGDRIGRGRLPTPGRCRSRVLGRRTDGPPLRPGVEWADGS
ncbi:hypothetical protein, partial [Kitasatospora aureofaciens]|uniref:hypothetical protein n=1 Tax=Kitasatospora aureofaciens TaxID=1894 RepID=UPI00340D0ECE